MDTRHPEKVNNPTNPIKKKPDWIRTKIIDTQNYFKTKEIINKKSKDPMAHFNAPPLCINKKLINKG